MRCIATSPDAHFIPFPFPKKNHSNDLPACAVGVECVSSQRKKKRHINPIDPLSWIFFPLNLQPSPSPHPSSLHHPYPNSYPTTVTIPCHKKVPTPSLHFTPPTNSSYTSLLPQLPPSNATLNNSSQQGQDHRITHHWSSPLAPTPRRTNNIIIISPSPSPNPGLKRKVHHDGQMHAWYWVGEWRKVFLKSFPNQDSTPMSPFLFHLYIYPPRTIASSLFLFSLQC